MRAEQTIDSNQATAPQSTSRRRSASQHAPARRWRTLRLVSTLVAGPALLVLSACGGSAPAAPGQPTVQAAATQVVGAAATAQAAASPVAATAQAAAGPASATVQAAASPIATGAAGVVGTAAAVVVPGASPSPSPSPAAEAQVRIADASLADATPWLSLQNTGAGPVDVGGWQLQVGTTTAALPESAVIQPGATLTLRAGEGMSSDDELYLGDEGERLASAARPGAPVRLSDDAGRVIAEVSVPRF